MAQKPITQCVLIALLTIALAMLFAVPDERLPMSAWLTLMLLSKALGIALFTIILNPRAPWSAKRT